METSKVSYQLIKILKHLEIIIALKFVQVIDERSIRHKSSGDSTRS